MHFYVTICDFYYVKEYPFCPQTPFRDCAAGPYWGLLSPDPLCVESKEFLKLNFEAEVFL